MTGPEFTPQDQVEWDVIQTHVERDIERLIEEHFEARDEVNRWRAKNGLAPK